MFDVPNPTQTTVLEQSPGGATLGLAGTEYQLRLGVDGPLSPDAHGRVRGVLRAKAQKIDSVQTGGIFIEPLYGPPRRIQGRVLAIDGPRNALVVRGPCLVTVVLGTTQRAADFAVGELVAFNVSGGCRFEPTAGR